MVRLPLLLRSFVLVLLAAPIAYAVAEGMSAGELKDVVGCLDGPTYARLSRRPTALALRLPRCP